MHAMRIRCSHVVPQGAVPRDQIHDIPASMRDSRAFPAFAKAIHVNIRWTSTTSLSLLEHTVSLKRDHVVTGSTRSCRILLTALYDLAQEHLQATRRTPEIGQGPIRVSSQLPSLGKLSSHKDTTLKTL